MLSNSNIWQLMSLCPSGGLCHLAHSLLRRLGWARSSFPAITLICHIFQWGFLKQNKTKREEELSPPADVQSPVRQRQPHPADPAGLTGTWPRLHPLSPCPGSCDGEQDLAPQARAAGKEGPACRWRCRPASGCAHRARPGAHPTRSLCGLKLCFNEENYRAGEKNTIVSPQTTSFSSQTAKVYSFQKKEQNNDLKNPYFSGAPSERLQTPRNRTLPCKASKIYYIFSKLRF